MKNISRLGNHVVIELERGEAAFLRSLPARLRRAMKPARYAENPAVDAELRQMLEADLASRRQARTAAFDQAFENVKGNKLVLDDHQAEEWLALLNDLRLALADTIGIEDESWERSLDVSKPLPEPVQLYLYLTSLQSALLDHGFGVSSKELQN